MKIAHVALWTRDLDEAVRFWTAYFGATAGSLYESRRRIGFRSCFLRLSEGPTIELMTGPWLAAQPTEMVEEIGWSHVAIAVHTREAVDALAERLDQAGLLLSQPRTTGDGFYEATARTPDGILIEITT
ncbi:VOC family protein [Xanthobacteraceae bacterium Astr-EGSB]|uniref:VOC family protein n=1 Tax=Astrobacterium formosum TaxID=3069710 RepID=UPI0027B251CA|nr:VOC family protein [Xanthobacteraceae bacterium Astr-EGSB]